MTADNDDPPSHIPLEHEAAIGRVARWWGHLEFLIDNLCWDLANVPHQFGACFTAQIGSIHYKLNALIGLVVLNEGSPDLIEKLKRFQGGLAPTTEKRNRAVHDARLWYPNKQEVRRLQLTAKGDKVVFGPQTETIDDLVAVRKDVAKQINRFVKIKEQIESELLTSPRKQPLQLQRIRQLGKGHGGPRSDS